MNATDGALLIGGIILPLVVMQVVFAATAAIIILTVAGFVYYKVYKAHLINTHPDKLLLEEIRRQH